MDGVRTRSIVSTRSFPLDAQIPRDGTAALSLRLYMDVHVPLAITEGLRRGQHATAEFWPHRLPRPAKPETGKPLGAPLHAACAALAMASAGAAVVIFHLSHGNWAIWSAYTVIQARRQTSLQRSARRALGAVIGCATGFVVIEIFRDIPMILTALTLAAVFFMVAFENYVLAVSVRSCLAPLAAIALHYDPITTVEARFLGIAVGVILGTLFTLLFTRRETRSLAT